MKRILLALLIVAALPTADATAQQPLTLQAHADQRGYIGLRVTGPQGASVTVSETAGGVPVAQLGAVTLTAGSQADLPHAARWRCSPRQRTFRADARTAAGEVLTADAAITTPRRP